MDETSRTGELRRKLEKDPGSRLFAQLAEELRKEGKHDEAISVARKGLETNPNYPSARLTLARALLESGRPAEAKSELVSIVKASPDNILASRLLGEAMADLGEAAQALQQFERTLSISPGDKAVLERMAAVKAGMRPAAAPARPAPPIAIPAAAPLPAAASVALDRDLASGTFSPGSLNAADIQRHFDDLAAAGANHEATRAPAPPAQAAAPPQMPAVDLPAVEMPPDELPALEMPPDDDLGATTLPLTSVTLADLYLQQGLKVEASAVLSQVLREEPENAQARSKLDAVVSDLAQVQGTVRTEPEPAASPAAVSLSRAKIRERTIVSLKAFARAVEREAPHQKATERGAF